MKRRRRRSAAAVVAAVASATAWLVACGDASDALLLGPDGGAASDGGALSDGGGFADAGEPIAEGVLLVHAASLPPLRLCFSERPEDPPLPITDRMPDSNVVGLDVGAVVRLPPRYGVLGDVFGYPERDLRSTMRADGGSTVTCGRLGESSQYPGRVRLGRIDDDVSRGLHLVAVTGCPPLAADPSSSVEKCGDAWSPASGNLGVVVQELVAHPRFRADRLPVQVVQLSPSLEARAAGRLLAFGVGNAGEPAPTIVVAGEVPFGEPFPAMPEEVPLAAGDAGMFATTQLVVQIVERGDGGVATGDAAVETVLEQSLADTQRLTLPSALPPSFFASVSSFLVLAIGDANANANDAGDPRTRLHLLAVPLGLPRPADGGAAVDPTNP